VHQNPEGDQDGTAKGRLEPCASAILKRAHDYLDWSARDWGTFKMYVAPVGNGKRILVSLVAQVPSEWTPRREAPFQASFTSGARCLWVVVYRTTKKESHYWIATDLGGRDPSC
jgi:hypothetical protein